MTKIELTEEDAQLFLLFQKHYTIVANVMGCMHALNLQDIKNAQMIMDFDNSGVIVHSSITKHYRKSA